jgi:STE24 endopeptidase
MLQIIIVLYTVYTLIKVYISVMQIGYISTEKNGEAVLMSQDKFRVAGEYAIRKERVTIVSTIVDYIMFIWWVSVGFSWLVSILGTTTSIIDSVIFLFIFMGINYIVGVPFELYQTFEIDKEYGFSKTTLKLYLQDQLKSIAIFLIFGGVVFALLSWIVITVSSWWILGFILLFSLAIVINVIYPTIIAPMFNKFSPMEDGELKENIENMMKQVGLKSDGIFIMDASKRDSRLNAYFGGLGKSKRVVLFDTLVSRLKDKELLAVLGHELGHFKHGDIWKSVAMIGVLLFIAFFLFGNLPQELFFDMGVEPKAGVKLAIMMLLLPLLGFIFTPIMSFVSRHNEYKADEFGSEIGGKENLVSALIKLIEENKAFPKSHPLVIFFYYTHPPVLERLKELGYDATAVKNITKPLPKDGIFKYFKDNK